MDFSPTILLMPHNYFEWKLKILHQLKCNGLYQITMAIEVNPNYAIKKNRHLNHMDEAYNLFCVSMSLKLMFHIESFTTPDAIWTNLEDLFGKWDKMRGHMLNIKLNSLYLKHFDNIQDFFKKF
jgi:hypothetical protein